MTDLRNYFYLPVGEREFNWGLYLTVVGHNLVRPHEQYPHREHPSSYQFKSSEGRILSEYQIILLTGGEGTFSSGEIQNAKVSAGDVLLIFPGVWHTYSPDPDTGWEDYWIGLNGSWITALCERSILQTSKPIYRPLEYKEIRSTFAELLNTVRSNGAINSPSYIVSIAKILTLLAEQPQEQELVFSSGKEKIVHEAVRVIWEWSYRTLTVNDIADSIQINRRTLERYFREVNGISIHDEIIRCRLIRAQQLLKKTRIPIHRIANMAGFSSHQQMCAHFAVHFRCTPETMRNSR
ncbi:MAG: AraC family transcriptional regulator [Planctomycetia bacterium]|nr:AraC family transcriptional regulator [Planctomycetia bacterium]